MVQHTGQRRHPGLPQSLLDQISQNEDGGVSSRRSFGHSAKHGGSRKDARKQGRLEKKQKKQVFFTTAKRPVDVEEHIESPPRKKAKTREDPPSAPPQDISAEEKKTVKPKKKKPKKPKKIEEEETVAPPTVQSRADEEEDAYIDYLESKLGRGQKTKKADAFGDGLDDLFDFTSTLSYSQPKKPPKQPLRAQPLESSDSAGTSDEESELEQDSAEEWGGIDASESDDAESDSGSGSESAKIPSASHSPAPETVAPTTAYVPPHLRQAHKTDDSATLQRLRKQLKGLLNRMSEQNLSSILSGIEEIYNNERRNDVTSTLTALILEGTTSHSSLLDSFVAIHAALVSSLQKMIGIEFAAHFVHELVTSYDRYAQQLNLPDQTTSDDTLGKECSNLLVLLSELYNFQVVSCVLIFDFIRGLLDGPLTELNVELLLKVIKSAGQQLRHDDPLALKDIVQIVQEKVAAQKSELNSRTLFMVETLNNLKNNKLKRAATQNQGGEAVERLKKFLAGLSKKTSGSQEPLRVSLEDLRSAETKGKWWLVGAAWAGDPLVERKQGTTQQAREKTEESGLLKLARKQGMNTQVRQSIFMVLMSSEDYIDACNQLAQLNLTEVQQREIIRVLVHCSGNEKAYNPYYTLICQHLCGISHSHKITLQYCLWDFLRELGESKIGGLEVIKNTGLDDDSDGRKVSPQKQRNLSRAFGWWFAKDSVGMSALKPVDFTVLKPQSSAFIRELLQQIFASTQVSSPLKALDTKTWTKHRDQAAVRDLFGKATRMEGLSLGLIYFLSEWMKELEGEGGAVEEAVRWAAGVAVDALRNGMKF